MKYAPADEIHNTLFYKKLYDPKTGKDRSSNDVYGPLYGDKSASIDDMDSFMEYPINGEFQIVHNDHNLTFFFQELKRNELGFSGRTISDMEVSISAVKKQFITAFMDEAFTAAVSQFKDSIDVKFYKDSGRLQYIDSPRGSEFLDSASSGNEWIIDYQFEKRDISNYFISDIKKNSVLENLNDFTSDPVKNWFKNRINMPWRRTFLIYGNNSSDILEMVTMIADYTGMNVYQHPPSIQGFNEPETSFVSPICKYVPEDSIYFIKEFETHINLKNAHKIEEMFNINSGIVIATTTNRKKLDELISSSTLFDYNIEVTFATKDTVQDILQLFYDINPNEETNEFCEDIENIGVSVEQIKRAFYKHGMNLSSSDYHDIINSLKDTVQLDSELLKSEENASAEFPENAMDPNIMDPYMTSSGPCMGF